jgi:hypothetical protein
MLTARQGSRQITLVNRGGLTESATGRIMDRRGG